MSDRWYVQSDGHGGGRGIAHCVLAQLGYSLASYALCGLLGVWVPESAKGRRCRTCERVIRIRGQDP